MIVYFAGNTGTVSREMILINQGCPRLFSYHFTAINFYNSYDLMRLCMDKKVGLFLDSGAYSAWTQGSSINMQEYIAFIKKHKKYIDIYANLDVIGIGGKQPNQLTAQKTLENQQIMEEAGLSPLPCFHFGEPFEYLEYYVENYEYIALGVAGNTGTTLIPWLDECFSKYICKPDGFPKIKVHGFAVTSIPLMIRYPWFSVDSTSWVFTGRMGGVFMPRRKDGKWFYDKSARKIGVSNKSPFMKKLGGHITTLSPKQRKLVDLYLEEKGFVLGHSTFHKVPHNYELKSNERWAEKKPIDKKADRLIEVIVEVGISNTYQLRDEMNILFFLDLQNSLPAWPTAFKLEKVPQGLF